jgi:hypothetical protein
VIGAVDDHDAARLDPIALRATAPDHRWCRSARVHLVRRPPCTTAPTTVRQVTDAQPDHVHDGPGTSPTSSAEEIDLDAVEGDLAAVEVALQRLSEGTYWTDEVTGEPIPGHVLAADPTARRA